MAQRRDADRLLVAIVLVPLSIAIIVGLVLLGTGRVVHRIRVAGSAVGVTVINTTTVPPVPQVITIMPAAPTTVVDNEAAAQAALNQQVAQDRPSVDGLVGYWVPQLSSKRVGMVANGIAYDYNAIWQDFQSLQGRYPNALLLWSGDYVSYASSNFWVTVIPAAYPDGPSANTWCDGEGIGANDCYAKFLSHTGGSTGTTLLRH
jgi:hypothetical protein